MRLEVEQPTGGFENFDTGELSDPEAVQKLAEAEIKKIRQTTREFLVLPLPIPDQYSNIANYCEKGFGLYQQFIGYTIMARHGPQAAQGYDRLFSTHWAEGVEKICQGNIEIAVEQDGSLNIPKEKSHIFRCDNPLVTRAGEVLPSLFSPIIGIQFEKSPKYRRQDKTPSERPSRQFFPYLKGRQEPLFRMWERLDKLLDDKNIGDFLSVIFATQAAKNTAVEEVRALLKEQRGLLNQESRYSLADPSLATQFVLRDGDYLSYHLEYVKRGFETLQTICERARFDDSKKELLLDLAFLGATNLKQGEYTRLVQPIIEALRSNRWEQAIACRDFLRAKFKEMFPPWKVAEGESHTHYRSIEKLVSSGSGEVPKGYEDLFSAELQAVEDKREAERQAEQIEEERKWLFQEIIRSVLIKIGTEYAKQLPPKASGANFDPNSEISERNPLPLPARRLKYVGESQMPGFPSRSHLCLVEIKPHRGEGLEVIYHQPDIIFYEKMRLHTLMAKLSKNLSHLPQLIYEVYQECLEADSYHLGERFALDKLLYGFLKESRCGPTTPIMASYVEEIEELMERLREYETSSIGV